MWRHITSQMRGVDHWFQWLDRITREKPSPLLNLSTFECVDKWLSKLPPETPDGKWLPYVNFYPKSWRHSCTLLFTPDWKQAQTKLWPTASAVHDSPTTVDIQTWIVTVLMSMFQNTDRVSWDMRRQKMEKFMDKMGSVGMKIFLQSLPALPVVEPTATMTNFRHGSLHTCLCPDYWYTSAMLLATSSSTKSTIPLYTDLSCVPCRIANDFHNLVREKKVSASMERQQKFNLLLRELVSTEANLEPSVLFIMCQAEIMAQEGLQLEFLDGDSRLNLSLSLTVSCHRPERHR